MEHVTMTEPTATDNLGIWGNITQSLKSMCTLDYWKDLLHQFTGWHPSSYILFGFALGLQLLTFVNAPITTLSIVTMLSTLLGVLCILSISSAKSVNGVLGLVSALGLIYVAFSAKNYLQITEQMVYIITLDIPVLLNVNWNKNMASKISKLTNWQWVGTIVGWALLWALSGWLIGAVTDDPRPVADALVFASATVGGILTFSKKRESYFAWAITGLTSVYLWAITFQQGDASIAMLLSALVSVMNDVIGFTVSPWFSKKGRARLAEQEAQYRANKK